MKILLDEGTTEFIIEDKGEEGYRFAIRNSYIDYDVTTHFFCCGDIEFITNQFTKFLNGDIKEVEAVSTTEPTLNFILRPKGARAIRELGESFVYYTIVDGQKKIREAYYACNSMRIELDLCLTGCYGVQHWSASLDEKETSEFCKQWLAEMHEY